jgi:hypothetical protein
MVKIIKQIIVLLVTQPTMSTIIPMMDDRNFTSQGESITEFTTFLNQSSTRTGLITILYKMNIYESKL